MKETKVYRIPLFVEDVERLMTAYNACSPSNAIQKVVATVISNPKRAKELIT